MTRKTDPKTASPDSPLPVAGPLLEHHGEVIVQAMRQWREQRKVPPVLLVTGVSGIGKREICHYLAQWLLCERSGFSQSKSSAEDSAQGGLFGGSESDGPGLFGSGSSEGDEQEGFFSSPCALPGMEADARAAATAPPAPCGSCASCRRALDGNWVDFREIAAEQNDDGRPGTLKIEQFRELKQSQGFGAHEGPFRITLILDADRMTPQAANSLLKLLEEPPAGWVFLLTASDSSLLLPTLVSRCQRLRLRPLGEAALTRLLEDKGIPSGRREICARMSQGSWRKALTLADDEYWDRRKSIFRFLKEPETELSALVDWAASEPPCFDLLLDQLESIASDLVGWSAQPAAYAWRNTDHELALRKHAESAAGRLGGTDGARAFWLGCFERIAEVRKRSSAPLNRKLLAQQALFPWTEIG